MERSEAKKLIKRLNRRYKRAQKSGVSDTAFFRTIENKLDILGLKRGKRNFVIGLKNVHTQDYDALEVVLKEGVTSRMGSKYGRDLVRRKRIKSLKETFPSLSNRNISELYNIFSDEDYHDVIEELGYISYREVISLAYSGKMSYKRFKDAYKDTKEAEEKGLFDTRAMKLEYLVERLSDND